MEVSLLQQVTQAKGIESEYFDAWGQHQVINEDTQHKILSAMGYDTGNEETLIEQLNNEAIQDWLTVIEPVSVVKHSQPFQLLIKLPIDFVNDELTLEIASEQDLNFKQNTKLTVIEHTLLDATEVKDIEIQAYHVELSIDLPLGYYQVALYEEGVDEALGKGRLIVTPQRCYQDPKIASGGKVWGPSVQLYALRSNSNWGVGDFSDLKTLIKEIGERGGDFVGLNPIHSLYPNLPESCSPYSPSSRRWLNTFYIDVTAVKGFDKDTKIQNLVNSEAFNASLQSAREAEYVDYSAVMALKMPVLKLLFQYFVKHQLNKNTKYAKSFIEFKNCGGDSLLQSATFDAIQEVKANQGADGSDNWGWPAWQQELQSYNLESVRDFIETNKELVDFYIYLQFLAFSQLEEVDQYAKSNGLAIGTYRDLAVGVSEGSCEVWGHKDLYAVDASVGAPPDVLGPTGQNWGLPPMDPAKLYRQGYQPIIDLFRSNMQSCGALRIDHVMALLRLWWIPKGNSAKDGAYVYYPVDDLLAILALESHLNRCSIIGEDLGTVPQDIIGKLKDLGIYSYKVFFFERAPDGGFFSPSDYVEQAMATLTTHDMPTIIGYWHCLDLELGKSVGLYEDGDILSGLYDDRVSAKQAILNSLHGHGAIPEHIGRDAMSVGMTRELNYAMQVHMAKGNSALLSLQLEDWIEMDKPVNVPGTFLEYPNWRRKLSMNLEDIFASDHIDQLARLITVGRQNRY